MKRRAFVQTLGAAAAGGLLLPTPNLLASTKKLDRIGLELYAVRHAMAKDPERTLAAVRAIGYTDVELLWSFDNFNRTPAQVAATLKSEGLRAPSAHMSADPMQYLQKYPDRFWTFHLKDTVADRSSDTRLGTGIFDFKRFLAAVPALNGKPCSVEDETPSDELGAARSNFQYLQGLDF